MANSLLHLQVEPLSELQVGTCRLGSEPELDQAESLCLDQAESLCLEGQRFPCPSCFFTSASCGDCCS